MSTRLVQAGSVVSALGAARPSPVRAALSPATAPIWPRSRQVKISDFGWSCCKVDLGKTFHVSWEWVAPEVLGGGPFSEKADMYSFAMVAWEVLTQAKPFEGMNPMQMGFAVGSQGYRPPIPEETPKGLSELIAACWHNEPQQRPSFASVLGKLTAFEFMGEQ